MSSVVVSFFSLLLYLVHLLQSLTLISALPSSSAPPPSFHSLSKALFSSNTHNDSSHFLKEVLKAISSEHRWNLEDIRVLTSESRRASFLRSRSYEFRVPTGKTRLTVKLRDKESRWKKLNTGNIDFNTMMSQASSRAVLDRFRIEGPFELILDDEGGYELILSFPINTTHSGLKRIVVDEGITVEVSNARGVSLYQASDLGCPVNRNSAINKEACQSWPFWSSVCYPPLPIKISGPVSLAAFLTQKPHGNINSVLLSNKSIQLLAEKCYGRRGYKRRQTCPIDFLSLRIAVVEKLLRGIPKHKTSENKLSFVKAQVRASTVVRFQLGLERKIRKNDTAYTKFAEWRTRPTTERVWFEVVAIVEAERLKSLVTKRFEPFAKADSIAWSSLMSNLSFTNFPSILVPQEALTLDVKW